ncbi:protein translocase subunit SecD [Eubacterium xylanophilum]|uniref:protein translocase subunit SecD n=1 Tax=Eubacterium xylanophilum TaxID=39497 RepID=UPI00047A20B0|nr:protein translocase subunit SecD [Eubacterium xylanophilum]
MNSKVKGILQVVGIVLVAAALCFVVFVGIGAGKRGSAKNIRLGLDLAGGVSVTYEANKANPTDQEMTDTVYKMQKRVENESTEASVYQEGANRVTVDVPDVSDPQAILDKLGKAGSLEFVMETDIKKGENDQAQFDKSKVLMDGSMIQTAEATTQADQKTGKNENVVKLTLTGKGAKKFATITGNHIGDALSIVYDGKVVSSPVIQAEITDGVAIISGSFDQFSQAEDMASTLRIGALPLELKNIRSNIVGAKLGVTSLKTSIYAGIVGLILVMIFMIVMYRLPGVVASISLAIYTSAALVAMNLLDVTLTLPGIAGVILAIGMAVDANCIIFTRIKEEIGTGKTVKSSIKLGFDKALSAIIDGNVTTLIAAVVLYIKGSGTVKGFAQTLAIGIIISMVTAIFVTRWLLRGFVNLGLEDAKFFGTIKERKTINFVGNAKKYIVISGAILLICIAGLIINKTQTGNILNYSLDFVGGTSTSITFDAGAKGFDGQGNATTDFKQEIEKAVKDITGVQAAELSDVAGENTLIVRTVTLSEKQQKDVRDQISAKYNVSQDKIEQETISASVSDEMRTDAVFATILAAIFMLIYIWIRFKNLAFGASSVAALIHDVMVVFTIYVVLSHFITVGSTFIAVMLTIVGYSINATIVIFDRIRENKAKASSRSDMMEIVNQSITQTLSRSINTSITTLIMVVVLAIMGVDSVRQFSIPLIAGIVSGCYSSVCLAGTIWFFLNKIKKAPSKKK